MPFVHNGSTRFFVFETLQGYGIKHGVFTRHGGVSPHPWYSLNTGATVGDHPERVKANRERIYYSMGLNHTNSFDVWQVHGKKIFYADSARSPRDQIQKADAIVTNVPGLVLFMRFADCIPMLLFDPVHKAIGILHAGWKGTINGIAAETVAFMHKKCGSNPSEIIAAIGPSIQAHHYEIGREVVQLVKSVYGDKAQKFLLPVKSNFGEGKMLFDLQKMNTHHLSSAGVYKIENSGICTACNLDDWYSHRGENGETGRFGALLVL